MMHDQHGERYEGPDLNAPVDSLHRACMVARRWINDMFLEAKIQAAKWEPRKCPPSR
jgi:hypothetical protein